MSEQVILVDDQNRQIGTAEKLVAHQDGGILHRAFSIFVFNDTGDVMLQRRAMEKYHCPGLWTNTCCSHQRPGETTIAAGKRRLQEEMGFVCELEEKGAFIYKAPFSNGLTEHEFDHLLVGSYNDAPKPNPDEVMGWKWISLEDLIQDIAINPDVYTPWMKIILKDHLDKLV